MNVSDVVLHILHTEGVKHVFAVPGQAIDPLMESLSENRDITTVICAHEAGAAYMADGYCRTSGKTGVCITTSGPGATNTLTPLATAFADRSPVLIISGEVSRCQEGRGALQDSGSGGINVCAMAAPVTVKQLTLSAAGQLQHHLRVLFNFLNSPATRGPVRLTIPADLQRAPLSPESVTAAPGARQPRYVDTEQTRKCLSILNRNTHIVILAGSGCVESGAADALCRFAERFSIPVATTLYAKGVFDEQHPLSLGVFGWSGNPPAIDAITGGETNILLVLGSRLNMLDTLGWHTAFSQFDYLIVNDINPHFSTAEWPVDLFIPGDCTTLLEQLGDSPDEAVTPLLATREARRERIKMLRKSGMFQPFLSVPSPLHPAQVAQVLRKMSPPDTMIFSDSGAHALFIAHYWPVDKPHRFFSSIKTSGPMGWAIPAAVGGAMARPQVPCIAITGDGCMLMHGTEIQTAARYQVPVIFIVMNNSALGNPQLRAMRHHSARAALCELPRHDWAMFARSLGVKGYTVNEERELESVLREAFSGHKPALVDIRTGNYPTPTDAFDNSQA